MTKKIVRLGLCGAGRWGKRFLETINSIPHLKTQGLFSRNPESKNLVPSDCFITPSWQELLERKDIDGIIIATPVTTHFEIALAAIEKKIPCMIEKPLTLSLDEARTLTQQSQENDTLAFVDHTLLFHSAYSEIKKRLQNEKIKEIHSEGSNWGPFRPDCNPLWDYGAHDAAFCLDLLGSQPQHIKALRVSPPTKIEGGQAGSYQIEAQWSHGTKAFIKNSNVEKKKTRILEVRTESKKFVFDNLAEKPLMMYTKTSEQIIPVDETKPLTNAVSFFADAITGEIPHDHSRLGLNLGLQVVNFLWRAERG